MALNQMKVESNKGIFFRYAIKNQKVKESITINQTTLQHCEIYYNK